MKLEEIAQEAGKLPNKERAELACRLLRGLDVPEYDVPDEEVEARMREADEDPSVMIGFDELVEGLRHRGSQQFTGGISSWRLPLHKPRPFH